VTSQPYQRTRAATNGPDVVAYLPVLHRPGRVAQPPAQVTTLVRSFVLPSLNVPLAASCSVPPLGIGESGATMETETSVGDGTVRMVVAVIEPDTARMVVVPGCFATALPDVSIGAIAESALLQATADVISCLLPSAK